MGQDLLQRRPIGRPVLEAAQDQILALRRQPQSSGASRHEIDGGADDLVVLFEGNIAADHVVEQDAQRPNGGWPSVVPPVSDPFRRRVNSGTCEFTNQFRQILLHTPFVSLFQFNTKIKE
jgi:hypothetical protein